MKYGDFACPECREITSGDCGKHGPFVSPPAATDPVAALAERLRGADTRWDDLPQPAGTYHEWLAREALAFARAQLPTREEIAQTSFGCTYDGKRWIGWRDADQAMYRHMADALLHDLTARLGG